MINTLFQCISMITRKGNIQIDQNDFITMFILNFDYILLMIISFKLNFTEGGTKLCGMAEVGLSSLFPNNTLLITARNHIVCSKLGIIYDTFDCRDYEVESVWLVN